MRIITLAAGFEETYAQLADQSSRRALVDVLALRVLGPFHSPLAIAPETFRAKQAFVDRKLREREGTFEVSDPYFSPISLYRIPMADGSVLRLHSHSVDVVSVFLLNQYAYGSGSESVSAAPGEIVLDVGGCWGDTALYFASLVGPRGKVYTFEFDQENLAILRENLALNPHLASRIEVVERALWETSAKRLQFVPAGRMTTLAAPASAASAPRAETITLDDFAEQTGLNRIGFVKLDVEGAEHEVLRGGVRSLNRFVPRLAIAAYHQDDDLVTIPARLFNLQELGYRLYLKTSSPVEAETVVFASPKSRSASSR